MKTVFKLVMITCLVLIFLIPAGLVIMVVDPSPHVRDTVQIDQTHIQRARQLLEPLKSDTPGRRQLKSLAVTETELNLLVGYGLAELIDTRPVAAKVHLLPETAVIYATIQIPDLILGKWINLAMATRPRPDSLNIEQVQVGHLRVPPFIVQWAAPHIHAKLMEMPRYARAISLAREIQTVNIDNGHLFLQFQWDPLMLADLTDEARRQMFSSAHQKRLIDYHNFLVTQASKLTMENPPLTSMLKPLFKRAMENTALSQDPVAENTAVLQVLAAYVLNQDLSDFLAPENRNRLSSSRPDIVFLLHGRQDLAQHFLSSAAITISASGNLARSMGLAKEMEDAKTGSGYSFVDITANESGIRFAEFAVSGPVQARLLQQRMQTVSHETQFMPDVDELPENMSADVFRSWFDTPHSPAFDRLMRRIEARIKACQIYQN